MEDVKSMLQSKTIWGAAIAVIASLAGLFHYDAGILNGAADEVVAVIGGLLAIYGRVKAVKKIG